MENKIVDKLSKSIEYEFSLSCKDNFELLSYIDDLQIEIQDLKEKVNYQDAWRKEYISRIDKAIELIESYELGKYDYSIQMDGIIELKDILKGE